MIADRHHRGGIADSIRCLHPLLYSWEELLLLVISRLECHIKTALNAKRRPITEYGNRDAHIGMISMMEQ